MLISIICVYNNKKILEEMLLESIKKQSIDYELILIDNTQNKFKCAADALNYGGNKANGELLLFVHQDVEFFENNFKDIISYCKNLNKLGIAGVAGVSSENNGRTITNTLFGEPATETSNYNFNTCILTQTLDELLLIIPRSIFNIYKFDNTICDGWHLYGADYCLNIKKNGFNVYILPIALYHLSKGQSMSIDYMKTLKKILKKYRNDYEYVYTTCLLRHNTKNHLKLNILYYLELIRLREPLMNFLSNFNLLKKILK